MEKKFADITIDGIPEYRITQLGKLRDEYQERLKQHNLWQLHFRVIALTTLLEKDRVAYYDTLNATAEKATKGSIVIEDTIEQWLLIEDYVETGGMYTDGLPLDSRYPTE